MDEQELEGVDKLLRSAEMGIAEASMALLFGGQGLNARTEVDLTPKESSTDCRSHNSAAEDRCKFERAHRKWLEPAEFCGAFWDCQSRNGAAEGRCEFARSH